MKKPKCETDRGPFEFFQSLIFSVIHYCSVTRLSDLLIFERLFKACGRDSLAQIGHIFGQFFKKVLKYLIFLVKLFLGNFLMTLGDFFLNPTGHPVHQRKFADNART